MKAIETERLILRDISSKDKHDLFINIFHDKKVLLYFLANYIDNEDDLSIDALISRMNAGKIYYSIILKENGECIGILDEQKRENNLIELGYAIGSKYSNNGYVTEALNGVLNFFKKGKLFKYIEAGFLGANIGSKKVLKKCGFKFYKKDQETIFRNGINNAVYYYLKELY